MAEQKNKVNREKHKNTKKQIKSGSFESIEHINPCAKLHLLSPVPVPTVISKARFFLGMKITS